MKKCEESGHSDLVAEIENDKMVFAAACRYYQSKQALEIGKVKESGVLSLKASELISAVNPTNQHCKKLSGLFHFRWFKITSLRLEIDDSFLS